MFCVFLHNSVRRKLCTDGFAWTFFAYLVVICLRLGQQCCYGFIQNVGSDMPTLDVHLLSRTAEQFADEFFTDEEYSRFDSMAVEGRDDHKIPSFAELLYGRANISEQLAYVCDFNSTSLNDSTKCFWDVGLSKRWFGKTDWKVSSGVDAFFMGGPSLDASGTTNGGYALFDVSFSRWSRPEAKAGWLVSERITPTDPEGLCVAFQYSLYGLGIDSLRVLLLYNVELNGSSTVLGPSVEGVTSYDTALLWEKNDTTKGRWQQGHFSFSSQAPFQLVFEALPSPILDKYEGYAAIDNIIFTFGSCPGDCNFDADFCGWDNTNGDLSLFHWEISRGTTNTITGPLRDYSSTDSKRLPGGYAYIDSSYPRKSGDSAKLVSPRFPTALVAEQPYCLTFWMSAYGPGIGDLTISLIPDVGNCTNCTTTGTTSVIWKLRPEKLIGLPDLWFPAQAVLVSPTDFRIVVEGTVGETDESDIGIDNISFQPGVCAAMPSMAAPPGDCTFDDDMCGWTVKGIRQAPYSPPLWDQVLGGQSPGCPLGHTRVPRYKIDSYMKFETDNYQNSPLDRSWLLSPSLTSDGQTNRFCLSFWVDMFAMVPTKDGLGALQVLIVDGSTLHDPSPKYQTIWRLTNHQQPKWLFAQVPFTLTNGTQVAFEGIEGLKTFGVIAVDDIAIFPIFTSPGICELQPAKAILRDGDCFFDTDNLCGWTAGGSVPGAPTWNLASTWEAPTLINDHTFGAPKIGFVFFNPAGQVAKQQAVLESPEVHIGPGVIGACFSFWFLAAGEDPDAILTVADRTTGALGPSELFRVRHADYASAGGTPRWNFGQVTVGQNVTSFKVHVYATATYGIFALDDVTIAPVATPCARRP